MQPSVLCCRPAAVPLAVARVSELGDRAPRDVQGFATDPDMHLSQPVNGPWNDSLITGNVSTSGLFARQRTRSCPRRRLAWITPRCATAGPPHEDTKSSNWREALGTIALHYPAGGRSESPWSSRRSLASHWPCFERMRCSQAARLVASSRNSGARLRTTDRYTTPPCSPVGDTAASAGASQSRHSSLSPPFRLGAPCERSELCSGRCLPSGRCNGRAPSIPSSNQLDHGSDWLPLAPSANMTGGGEICSFFGSPSLFSSPPYQILSSNMTCRAHTSSG